MKLLSDENLSHRLVAALADLYPESAHVRDLGLRGAEDRLIWELAAKSGFLLTSKDRDFYDRSVLFGATPKVVWLRIGNGTVGETAELLRRSYILVRNFAGDPSATFLPLRR